MKIIAKIEKGQWLYVTSDKKYIGHDRYIKLSEIVSFENGYTSGYPSLRLNVKGDIAEVVESKKCLPSMILNILHRALVLQEKEIDRKSALERTISDSVWKDISKLPNGTRILEALQNEGWGEEYTFVRSEYCYGYEHKYYSIRTYRDLFNLNREQFCKFRQVNGGSWYTLLRYIDKLKSSAEWKEMFLTSN